MPYGIDDRLWRMLAPDDQAAIASKGKDTVGGYADKVSQYDAGAILAAKRGSPRPAGGSRSRGSTVSGPTRATGGKGPESKGAMASSRGKVVPPTRAHPITVRAVVVHPVYVVAVFWVDEAGRVHLGPRVGKGRIVAPSVTKLRRQGVEIPGLAKGEAKKVVVPIGLHAYAASGTVKPTPGERKPRAGVLSSAPLVHGSTPATERKLLRVAESTEAGRNRSSSPYVGEAQIRHVADVDVSLGLLPQWVVTRDGQIKELTPGEIPPEGSMPLAPLSALRGNLIDNLGQKLRAVPQDAARVSAPVERAVVGLVSQVAHQLETADTIHNAYEKAEQTMNALRPRTGLDEARKRAQTLRNSIARPRAGEPATSFRPWDVFEVGGAGGRLSTW